MRGMGGRIGVISINLSFGGLDERGSRDGNGEVWRCRGFKSDLGLVDITQILPLVQKLDMTLIDTR